MYLYIGFTQLVLYQCCWEIEHCKMAAFDYTEDGYLRPSTNRQHFLKSTKYKRFPLPSLQKVYKSTLFQKQKL